jgi:hypothetical protein
VGEVKREKPTKPCYSCSGTDYWQRPDGGWLCKTCHPSPETLVKTDVKNEIR